MHVNELFMLIFWLLVFMAWYFEWVKIIYIAIDSRGLNEVEEHFSQLWYRLHDKLC